MTTLPFKDNSVDCVVQSYLPLSMVTVQPLLKKTLRVLKPGGKLVAMVHHKKSELVKDSARGAEIFNHIFE